MAISLEELTTPLTSNEIKASIYKVIELTGTSTTVWKPGAVVRTLIAAVAIVLAAFSSLVALLGRAGFVSLSSGLWKAVTAFHVYGVTKQEATFASGVGLLSNSSGALYEFDPGELVVMCAATKKTYTNTAFVSVGFGATDVPCAFSADESGSASTALVGEVDTVIGGFSGLTVTNAIVWIGLDAESDEALQAKCDEKLGALSPNGPSDAYAHVARNAVRLDGTPIGVTHVRVVPDGDLGIDVYVATATGVVPGVSSDPATDLGAVHYAIQTQAVPIPMTERTHSATQKLVSFNYTARLYNTRGYKQADVEAGVARALTALIAGTPIGGYEGKLDADQILAAILTATDTNGNPLGIFAATHTAADVTLAASEKPALGDLVATSVVFVAPPAGSL